MSFQDIALVVVAAGIFGIFAKLLKQPLLVGYLFAGIVLVATGIFQQSPAFISLSQIGVTLLLFLIGIQINLHSLKSIGKVAIISGIIQVIATCVSALLLSLLLGFSLISSMFISLALTFSSTIIVVKLLSDKKDLGSLYGQITLGTLLVQDFVAILILIFLSAGSATGGVGIIDFLLVLLKAIILLGGTWFLSKRVIPLLFEKTFSSSSELLFIGSLSWAFGVAAIVYSLLGFTLEIGGFLAGLSLSALPEHLQISAKLKPLKDFFLIIFFLVLGTQLIVNSNLISLLPIVTTFTLFVILVKPFIAMACLGFQGYKKRTSFKYGITLSQVSEFSFILIGMGSASNMVDAFTASSILATGVITIVTSTYLSANIDNLYSKLSRYINFVERNVVKEKAYVYSTDMENHIVLVGCDRTGSAILPYLKKKNYTFVVVDFNPRVQGWLSAEKVPVVFGDINDEDIQESANIKKAKMIISTTSDYADNALLLERITDFEQKPLTVFTSLERREAVKLYEKGANFVVVPEVLAGDYIKSLLRSRDADKEKWINSGKSDFNRLISNF